MSADLAAFTYIADRSAADLTRFANELTTDPVSALKRSTDAFQAAARLEVAKSLIYSLTTTPDWKALTTDQAIENISSQLLNATRYPSRTPSPTVDLFAQCRITALTEALDQLRYYAKRES